MVHASVSSAVNERAAQVRLMIFDVDGVLTDGRLYFSAEGESLKAFDTLDGQGLKLLAASGVQLALITGRCSQIVAARAQELGIAWVYQGVRDKAVAFAELLSQLHYTAEQCGYMGDDWPDLPVMLKVAFAAAPANAHAEVLARAHWVAQAQGGAGAVREVCDLILQAQHSYAKLLLTACGQA
ncbi:HAD family hydrolase [Mycoavidus sp. B2-EB]|uniref:KdsC family phosphatase n=1 Tax=Mycoavidus sp. B2-EB TaxID=2651972 RepID=UPI0016232801|nr:HAD hydrolase family protein [Mycoavidus sp. B2-EB]BBO59355.1 3-deoxy-D-manno-octulosonate 8-phosphate phosphatase [Mycoavidus sp. B2-EB]